MISEEQIKDIIDSDITYSKEYFVWQMNPTNISIEQFFTDYIQMRCEPEVLALMQHTGNSYESCEHDIANRNYLVLKYEQAYDLALGCARESCENAFSGLPTSLRNYINEEAYIEDYLEYADFGYILASSDGNEYEEVVDGTTYYIYKQ